jgi:hypothetical protein
MTMHYTSNLLARFWKEKSDKDMVILGPMAQATLIIFTVILMIQSNNIMLYYYVKVYILKIP